MFLLNRAESLGELTGNADIFYSKQILYSTEGKIAKNLKCNNLDIF